MDVRCEKCQTEYELDESRLKPGGVTVKCTNCGHMFKIRKRTPTNVGLPAVTDPRNRPVTKQPIAAEPRPEPATHRVQAVQTVPPQGDVPANLTDQGSGPTSERQWLVRLENGEQRTCRELATLQQWIVAGVVGRESLISRSGKTWKRLGDISELHQYFLIADEARATRAPAPVPSTMLGLGQGPKPAAGGTIPPDDQEQDDGRSTGSFRSRPRTTPPPPPPPRTAGASGSLPKANPLAQTELSPTTGPHLRASTTPPPAQPGTWMGGDIKASDSMAAMPQGPRGGRLSAPPDNEPAFGGRVRLEPGSESSFQTGKVNRSEDDDDMIPGQRGSRAGTWIALIALLVIAGGAGAVYMVVFKKGQTVAAPAVKDAAVVAVVADASLAVPVADAAVVAPVEVDPLDGARHEIMAGVEPRMKGVFDALASKDDGPSLAMRARLGTALAQSMIDRAGLVTDKAESDKLRKDSKQLVIDAAPLAQRALKAAADDTSANLAMADVLRLQSKPAKDVRRYLELAKTKGAADKELARSIALGDAQLLAREAKLDDALKELAALDGAGDNRVGIALALVAYAQNKPADAKPFVDAVLAASPDHEVARALQKRLDTMVTKTDPMPHEGSGSVHHDPVTTNNNGGGGDYDSLVTRANKLAETNCAKAMEVYTKALEQKVTGVEALTGMGYCFLDAKQFSSAFSKFRSALAVSSHYEPALAGIAETYQQQNNKEQAIEAWRKYLEVFPSSAKGKRQLEILGASADSGGGGAGSSGAGSAAPPPTPAPAPAAGSGSSS